MQVRHILSAKQSITSCKFRLASESIGSRITLMDYLTSLAAGTRTLTATVLVVLLTHAHSGHVPRARALKRGSNPC
jgi:hypothetical protein